MIPKMQTESEPQKQKAQILVKRMLQAGDILDSVFCADETYQSDGKKGEVWGKNVSNGGMDMLSCQKKCLNRCNN